MNAPTPRQLAVLAAYVLTGSHKAAAHSLGLSEATVRNQISRMHDRIGVTSTAQAVYVLHDELERIIAPALRREAA